MNKPDILLAVLPHAGMSKLAGFDVLQDDFTVHYADSGPAVDEIIRKVGPRIRAAVVSNGIGLDDRQISALPSLEFIQTRGMGIETYNFDVIREQKIVFANSRSANSFSVAEHAMALLLTLVRDLKTADADVREGRYEESRKGAPRALIYGKRMGILGLGDIGMAIARRAIPFEVSISYHNRKPRTDVSYPYVDSLRALAEQSDILIIAVPGGPETRHMVDRAVLEALGPDGYLVNVGRGTVVNTADLVDALHDGTIAGAALDVFEGEPNVPEPLLAAPNVILSPHLGSRSKEARVAAVAHVHRNLKAHFAGKPVSSRIV